ncbi:helix-turn-helix domain-containing protein [Embleya sp. NPDC020630]|uniref:helix-turn-helix domain-containing protein n=1 Tax=Embleya sp. NPDC020630 TaxID=3363979 RepID=UPI0037A99500
MPYPLRPLDGSLSPRHHLGAELRHWRKRARLSQGALGALVHVSEDLIGKIEKATRRCDEDLATRLDEVLDTGGVLVRAWRLAAEADRRAAEADSPSSPASSSSTLEQPSTTAPDGINVLRRDFISGAAALTGTAAALAPPAAPTRRPMSRRPVDPALVTYFREQLQGHYRADILLGPHQLVATVTAQHQLICELSANTTGDLRRNLLRVGAAYAALLGWLHQDAGDHPSSIRWRDITLDMAHRARDHQLVGYALANKASLCVDLGDASGAVDLADAALADPRALAPKVQVIASVHGAHGRSLTGDRAGVDALLGEAQELVERIEDDLPWGNACRRTPGYIDIQRATCYGRLQDRDAIEEADRIWTRVLAAMPDAHRRDVAVFRARHAAVAAAAGEPERALYLAERATLVSTSTGSARTRAELAILRRRMLPWADHAYGRDLTELLATIGL